MSQKGHLRSQVCKDKGQTSNSPGNRDNHAGAVYEDGVVFARDTRASKGTIAVDKNCQKHTSYLLTATAMVLGPLWAQTRRPSSFPPTWSSTPFARAAFPELWRPVRGGRRQMLSGQQGYTGAALALGTRGTGPHLCSVCSHGQPASCLMSPWVPAP